MGEAEHARLISMEQRLISLETDRRNTAGKPPAAAAFVKFPPIVGMFSWCAPAPPPRPPACAHAHLCRLRPPAPRKPSCGGAGGSSAEPWGGASMRRT